MKSKRITASLLALAVCLSLSPPAGARSYTVSNVGTVYREDRLELGDGTTLTQTTMQHQSSGVQEERYIEWSPYADIRALVVHGGSVYGNTLTLNTLQQRLQAQGRELTAACNGGYFSMTTGVQDGILITDGILRATDNFYQYVGFPAAGGALISSSPQYVTMNAQIGGQNKAIAIDQVNHARTASRLILFTPDFGSSTQTSTAGVHVVCNVTGSLTVGGTVSGTVDRVVTGKEPCTLKSGQMVLSVADTGPKSRLDGLTAGTSFTISVSCADNRIKDCLYAIGGYQRLLTAGQVASGLAAGTAPRTAVGIKADGTSVFYTVDGRQSGWSEGLSLTDLARRLQSLGCVDALNLDGGGSTILGARYPGQNTITVTGRPSDGSQRKVADYIVLVNDTPKLNSADRLFLYPNDVTVLKGATTSFTATATDDNYHAVSVPSLDWWSSDDWVGVMEGGRFTAVAAGTCQVLAAGGYADGAASVRVVDKPDSLQFVNDKTGRVVTALNAAPGEKINLTARALVDKMPVVSQNSCFTWTVDGLIGTVDQNGVFTAANGTGINGTIHLEYNGNRSALPVTVGTRPSAVETFENGSGRFGSSSEGMSFRIENDPDQAKFGLRSGRVTYDFGEKETARTLTANVSLPSGSRWLNVWVSGDNSKNKLELSVTNASGGVSALAVCTLDFTGYKQFQLQLPSSASKISALRVVKTNGGAGKGSFLTDQWVASAQRYDGTKPPVVSFDQISYGNNAVTVEASALDAAGLPLAAADVTLSWDGVSQTISYSQVTGRFTFTKALSDFTSHRLTLEAVDPAGNRNRLSADVRAPLSENETAAEEITFDDLADTHWAAGYISYLCARGVLDKPSAGQTSFFPDKALTRADMALYVARFWKLDLSKYNDVKPPFTDLARIPQNAAGAVRALYSLGVIKGKSNQGKLFFDPAAPITRAEFCALLGRTLPRGYPSRSPDFSDAGKIPSYAKPHIQTFLALGFINGYTNNTMRPSGNITRAEAAKILTMYY